jgi:glycerol uptake facilitator-like aquaporin
MLKSVLAEAVGTFVFVAVILSVTKWEPDNVLVCVAIGLTLAVCIMLCSKISMGCMNPVVAIAFFMRGDLDGLSTAGYVAGEVIGAVLAYVWFKGLIPIKTK